MKSRIIAVANHKGGVGKTTTTSSLGSILASKGYKVLLVDLDAQANLTTSLASFSDGATIYEAMTGKVETLPIVILHDYLHLIPASLTLAMADVELSSAIARERILSDLLIKSKAVETYDFILFDCPPSLGLMTLNAFTASTDILIPLVAEVLPFKGLTMINDFIKMVHARLASLSPVGRSATSPKALRTTCVRHWGTSCSARRYVRMSGWQKPPWRMPTLWTMTQEAMEQRIT